MNLNKSVWIERMSREDHKNKPTAVCKSGWFKSFQCSHETNLYPTTVFMVWALFMQFQNSA